MNPYSGLRRSNDLRLEQIRDNHYEFISDRARNASDKHGVKSVSLVAIKPSNGTEEKNDDCHDQSQQGTVGEGRLHANRLDHARER